jgi:hypothetical protein
MAIAGSGELIISMCIKWHEFTTKKYTINSILSENIKLVDIEPKDA